MVKTLPTVERSTKIRFGRHAQEDQGENSIVLNASNTAVDATEGGAVYITPVRFEPNYDENDAIVLMMYNTTTKEMVESGEPASTLISDVSLQGATLQGNVTANSMIFYNNTVAFVTSGNVGISNALASHTLSVGSNLYVDDYGTNVLVVSGGVGITDTTTSTSATTGALKVAGGISTEENLNVGGATDASSKTTGALIVTGGVGISKNIHALNANFEDVEADSVDITDTTLSYNQTTGALKVAGGLGVAGNVHCGNLTLTGNLVVTGNTTVINANNLIVQDPIIELGKGNASGLDTGIIMNNPLTGGNKGNVAMIYDFSTSNLEIGHTLKGATDSIIVMNTSNTLPVNINGTLGVTGSTTSSSKTTGAVTIGGGLGVVGDIHATHVNFEDVEADSVTITDNTTSSSATTGALKVVGGISTQENLNVGAVAKVISATDASSKTTGALIVSGGLGVAKNIHGKDVFVEDVVSNSVVILDTTTSTTATSGALKVAGGISTQENLNVGAVAKVISATDATSKTTGALIVTGGLGVAKNIHGKNVFVEDVVSNSVVILDTTTSDSATTGALKVVGGISTQENLNVGAVAKVISGTDATSKTTGALIVTGGLGVAKNIHGKNVFVEDVVSNSVVILDTTTSTSVTTGALKVAGGISTQEKLNVGGITKVWDDTVATSRTTGAVQVVGGLGVSGAIFGNTGNFDGNITVAGDLIVSGNTTSQGQNSLTVSDPTIELGIGNANGADLGIIMNNPLTGGNKGNVAIIYDFSTSKLEIGHTLNSSADSVITMNTANTLAVNINGSLGITDTTDATSKTTGALIVTGGLGVAKNIHGKNVFVEDVVSNSVVILDNTTSDSATTGALKVVGGISTQENLNVGAVAKVISGTDATSKTTGALIVTGGLGVAKNIHGKNVFVEDVVSNSVVILDTTDASSKTTGALKVSGGLGVAGNVHSSNIFAGYDLDLTSYMGRAAVGFAGETNHASFAHVDNNTSGNYALKQTEGGTTHVNAKAGQHIRLNVNNSEKARLTGAGDLKVGSNVLYVDVSETSIGVNTASPEAKLHVVGNAYVSSTTDATTTTTGALIVAGGLGIAKKIVGQHASFEDVTATSVTASAMVKGATISGTNVYGTLAGANTAAVTTLTASGMVKGATISGTNVYGTLAGANTAAVTTLTASGMVKGATISGTNVYGTLAGANTAAVTTLTASGMVKGATISGTNVYGTLAGANTAAVTTLTASGMVKGATISGTNVYGTLAGANTAAVTTLTASGMVKGATISGTNVYGTLAGANTAAVTTLSASGVVTLTDATEATSSTTGALKAAGGVGIAKDVFVGERAYVTGGLITNTGGLGRKTYSLSNSMPASVSPTTNIHFTSNIFHAKITATLVDRNEHVSTILLDVNGGSQAGSINSGSNVISVGNQTIFGTTDNATPWASNVSTTANTVALYTSGAMAVSGNVHVFVEYMSPTSGGGVHAIAHNGDALATFGY